VLKLIWRNCGHSRRLDVIVTLGTRWKLSGVMGYGVRGMGYMVEAHLLPDQGKRVTRRVGSESAASSVDDSVGDVRRY
jgi:hypothetical protein